MKKLKGLIFAGNRREANAFLARTGLSPKEYRYITTPESIMGLSGLDVIRVGTFYERPWFYLIHSVLEAVLLTGGRDMYEYEFESLHWLTQVIIRIRNRVYR